MVYRILPLGGADFTVRLWDLYSGDLLHTFAVHGGEVKDIIPCPPNINVSIVLETYFSYITPYNTGGGG